MRKLDAEEKRFLIGAAVGLILAIAGVVSSPMFSLGWALVALFGLPLTFGAIAMFWKEIWWPHWPSD